MTVGIIRSSREDAKRQIVQLLALLGYTPKRTDVLIKPNVVAPVPAERGVITDPVVVAGIVEFLLDHRCRIVIAESSSVAQRTASVLQMTGYVELARRYGVELLDLEEAPRIKRNWEYGVIALPEIAYTHSYINVAKMKTHIGTRVSLGLKNQKGLVSHADKRRFHLQHDLDRAIFELSKVVSPELTIIDGIIALEGDGPGGAGTPVDMQVLLAGSDIVQTDSVALQLMGFRPGEVEHVPVCAAIETVGVPLSDVQRDFVRAKRHRLELGAVRYFTFGGCSGCTERLAGGLRRAGQSRFNFPLNVVAGPKAVAPDSGLPCVCFGDCTKRLARERGLAHVGGCPPEFESVASIPSLVPNQANP